MPKPPSKQARHAADLAAIGPDPQAVRAYLDAHANLPGPRGNLELAHAFADWAPDELVDRLAPDDDEYVRFCTVLALGQRLAGRDDPGLVEVLRDHARDARWRVREAVATGLQRVGDRDLPRLAAIVEAWARDGDPLVQRAAVAAICEPRLLASEGGARAALAACRATTGALAAMPAQARRRDDVRTLRQALGYCWSVAVAADPSAGLPEFSKLRASEDPDVRWIVRENLRKARLQRVLTPSP
ncbi:MAG: HEAT repeat domain-containing protein [Candidatus Nanopelagicales bacterium]|jgi:HEAT repeat protein|nr:HEAT repeat domain-containing protein [Candidatus Nanopelagicales bacterium]